MSEYKLFSPYNTGIIELKNRVVMSPMTRSRAIGNMPNQLMATYYGQRSGAGLIITEGTSPSPNGLGYSRIPGIFNTEQANAWKLVTKAVHTKGSRIFVQLMHTGRIAHSLNLPEGAEVIAPSAVKAAGQMWTDQSGLLDMPIPRAMDSNDIEKTKNEYVHAARLAVEAGFDGVELHGANGYLLEQFLSPVSNHREDLYGGSIENRCRFIIEVTEAVSTAIGKYRTGIRLSPYGVGGNMAHYPGIDDTYAYLSEKLNKTGIMYIHIVDHSSQGAPEVPARIKQIIRERFGHTLILSGGYTKERAEADLQNGKASLIAFGKPFINNPDLVERMQNNWTLSNQLDTTTFYTPGEKGYTDYTTYNH